MVVIGFDSVWLLVLIEPLFNPITPPTPFPPVLTPPLIPILDGTISRSGVMGKISCKVHLVDFLEGDLVRVRNCDGAERREGVLVRFKSDVLDPVPNEFGVGGCSNVDDVRGVDGGGGTSESEVEVGRGVDGGG